MKYILTALTILLSVNTFAQMPEIKGEVFCGKVISLEKSILRMELFGDNGRSLGEGDILVSLVPESLLNIARIAKGTNQKYCLVMSYVAERKSKAWITTMDEDTLR